MQVLSERKQDSNPPYLDEIVPMMVVVDGAARKLMYWYNQPNYIKRKIR